MFVTLGESWEGTRGVSSLCYIVVKACFIINPRLRPRWGGGGGVGPVLERTAVWKGSKTVLGQDESRVVAMMRGIIYSFTSCKSLFQLHILVLFIQ